MKLINEDVFLHVVGITIHVIILWHDFGYFQGNRVGGPENTSKWPILFFNETSSEVSIKYRKFKFLGLDYVGEVLGRLILILNVFNMDFKNRSQLHYILETCYFGYRAIVLKTNNDWIPEKIRDRCKPESKSIYGKFQP